MASSEIPQSVRVVTGQSCNEFVRAAKIIRAAKLFEEGGFSAGNSTKTN